MMTSSSSDSSSVPSSSGGGLSVLVVDESDTRLEAMAALLVKEIDGGQVSSATDPGQPGNSLLRLTG